MENKKKEGSKKWWPSILKFFNGSDPVYKKSILGSVFGDRERQKVLAREHYRMEKFWKPLWKLFLIICVIYTILHILKIGPLTPEELNELRR